MPTLAERYKQAKIRFKQIDEDISILRHKKSLLVEIMEILRQDYVKETFGLSIGDVMVCKTPGSGFGELVFARIDDYGYPLDGPCFIIGKRITTEGTLEESGLSVTPGDMKKIGTYQWSSKEVTYL